MARLRLHVGHSPTVASTYPLTASRLVEANSIFAPTVTRPAGRTWVMIPVGRNFFEDFCKSIFEDFLKYDLTSAFC
jgi:hypothetical protein